MAILPRITAMIAIPTCSVVCRSLWLGCKILHDIVAKKFESNALSAVGGLFFLRFLCPALLNPASVGLTIGMNAKSNLQALTTNTNVSLLLNHSSTPI
jgi:hypothetical protein